MTRLNIALLALLPGALAVPRLHNRHEKHHHSSGMYPSGAPVAPTGGPAAPYGYGNATSDGPTGTGTASGMYSTLAVSPLPVTSNGAVSAVNGNAPVSENSPVSGTAGSGSCGPATVTVTSANTVTVTVGADAGGAAGSTNAAASVSPSKTPVSPVSVPDSTPYGNGTSTAGPVGTGTAPIGTGVGTGLPVYSSLPVYSAKPASSSSIPGYSAAPVHTAETASASIASSVASVAASTNAAASAASSITTAAAFYQKPTQQPQPSTVAPPSQVTSVPASSTSVAPSSSSSSSASASASSSPVTGDVKARGLAYRNAGLTDLFQTSAVGWGYNWDQTAGSLISGVQFVPMLHDNQADTLSKWSTRANIAISAGSTHLLAFNEPEQPPSAGGSGMSPQQVIDGWNKYMKPLKDRAKLGSPAVTSQEGSDTAGLPLLKTFLAAFGDSVDFICVHWYGTDFSQFQQHISDAKKVANGKPIWLTEFAHNDPAQAASFMAQALPWLDNPSNGVERYAYQFVDTTLTSGQSLSAAGKVYNGKA